MCRPRWTDRLIRPFLRALIVALLLGAGAEPALATPTPKPTPMNTAAPIPTATATPVTSSTPGGLHPALLGFLGLVTGGVDFVLLRLLR